MGLFVGIGVGLVVACTAFAVLGAHLGARMEQKHLGAGTVETEMRAGLSPNVLGALLGVIPFLIFVVVLLVTDATTDHGPSVREEAAASRSAAAGRGD